ncbi:MAG: hypothetical protein ACR2PF_07565 [Rhizobiaceae bacterium]
MRHFDTVLRIWGVAIITLSLAGTANARSITILPGTPAASINALIESSEPGDRVMMREGVFNLDEALTIARDGVSMVGQGSGKTVLRFDIPAGDFLSIQGGKRGKVIKFAKNTKEGEAEITLNDARNLKAGDALYLYTPNTPAYIAQWQNVKWNEARDRPFRESIHRIAAIEGNRVSLITPLPFALTTSTAKAQKIVLRKNVQLSGFTITSKFGKASPTDFTNTLQAFNRVAAIRAHQTQGLGVGDIAITDAPSTAMLLESSIEAEIDGLTIRGAHNKGGGGNGYGVELREAFENTLRNLVVEDMRHAVIFSAWHAEARNSIHVTRTNRDINFHGSVDLDNTVVVNELTLSYAEDRSPSKRRNVWKVISAGGTNHALTDFLAVNTVSLKQAKGSWRDDVLVAANQAVLAGGFGKDRFVIRSQATITDFEKGDVLDFTSARPIRFEERGRDIVLTLSDGGEVVLRDQL